jgi:SWI/SNF-related matrix-associated actin-dependent regulator of chromatin subfamily A3
MQSLLRFVRVPPVDNTSTFRAFITDPLKAGDAQGLQNLRSVLDTFCLRRTRNILTLPDIAYHVDVLDLSESESEIYKSIVSEAKRAIERAISNSSTTGLVSGILQLILRCRLLCNHGTLLREPFSGTVLDPSSESREFFTLLQQLGQANCAHCNTQIDSLQDDEFGTSGILKACSHFVCQGCHAEDSMRSFSKKRHLEQDRCSLCSEETDSEPKSGPLDVPMPSSYLTLPQSQDRRTTPWRFSTKISALIEELTKSAASSKSIIFSCWRKTLDLVESELRRLQIHSVRLDGAVSAQERQKVIEIFNNTDVPVLLMTTGTGSVGLSLTIANQVFIMEPQWNPAVEDQAIGRAMRLGQMRPVSVTRYIMRGTIEETIRARQSRKIHLAELTLMSDSPQENMLSKLMALKSLFQ